MPPLAQALLGDGGVLSGRHAVDLLEQAEIGQRRDDLVTTSNPCGKVAVLVRGDDRLILAFNDKPSPQPVTLTQAGLAAGARAHLFFENRDLPDAGKIELTIPGEYLVAVQVQGGPVKRD